MDNFDLEQTWQKIRSKFGVKPLTTASIAMGLVLFTPKIVGAIIAGFAVLYAYGNKEKNQ